MLENSNMVVEDNDLDHLLEGIVYSDDEIEKQKLEIMREYPDINKFKRVCCYGRVSTKHEEQDSSIGNQHELFSIYRESRLESGWVIVEEIYERKTAAKDTDRPKFDNMINRALNKEFDVLLFKSTSRFSRKLVHYTGMLDKLKEAGVVIHFIQENIDTGSDDDTFLKMHGIFNERFSTGLSVGGKASVRLLQKRDVGRVPTKVFGYDKDGIGDSSQLRINHDEAAMIKELFIRLSKNEGFSSICSDWRERGILTKNNKCMSTEALRRFARNKIYKGVLVMNRTHSVTVRSKREKNSEDEYIIRHRPDLEIVDPCLFDEVQLLLDNRRDTDKRVTKGIKPIPNRILSGVIKCECCGSSLTRIMNHAGDVYLKCNTNKEHKRKSSMTICESSPSIRIDVFLKCMELYFIEILKSMDAIEMTIKNKVNSLLEKRIGNSDESGLIIEIQRTKDKLKRASDLYIDGLCDKDKVLELQNELKRLEVSRSLVVRDGLENLDIRKGCLGLCSSIEEFVHTGVNESTLDGFKFNSLFESVTACESNKLVVIFKADCGGLSVINGGGRRYHRV